MFVLALLGETTFVLQWPAIPRLTGNALLIQSYGFIWNEVAIVEHRLAQRRAIIAV